RRQCLPLPGFPPGCCGTPTGGPGCNTTCCAGGGAIRATNTSFTASRQPGMGRPFEAHTRTNCTPAGGAKSATCCPTSAVDMNCCQIGAAVLPLVAPCIGELSALPTHTPATSCGV